MGDSYSYERFLEEIEEFLVEAGRDSVLAETPFELFHCLTEEQLRLALTLRTYRGKGVPAGFSILFVPSGDYSCFEMSHGRFSFDTEVLVAPPDLNTSIVGNWFLRSKSLLGDLSLGLGSLVLSAGTACSKAEASEAGQRNPHQVGFFELARLDLGVARQESFIPQGIFTVPSEKLFSFLPILNGARFCVEVFDPIACAVGETRVDGPMFSVGASGLCISTDSSTKPVLQGGSLFEVQITKVPAQRTTLAKFIEEATAKPFSTITEAFQRDEPWQVGLYHDLRTATAIYKAVKEHGCEAQVQNYE